jgi:hypothetical protein
MKNVMMNKIKSILFSISFSISLAFKRFEDELKADPIDLFKREHRLEVRDMMSMFDQQYVKQFYEILKKADKFLQTSNPSKIRKTAGKFGLNYGMKDSYGRRFEHYGFFDDKHKYSGKSLKEVRELEIDEKKIKDDDYPIVVMYQNKKEFSLIESADIMLKNNNGYFAPEIDELARMKKYPLTIVRDDKVANRIEQLTEFLHVKKIDETNKILEFMIPIKFGLSKINETDSIFKELINIKQVWFKDEYGDRNAYSIESFYKRGEYKKLTEKNEINPNGFDVIKFRGTDIIELK